MSHSSRSRTSSVSTLESTASSYKSATPQSPPPSSQLKSAPGLSPLVLRCKHSVHESAFTSTKSSYLRFTAFLPHGVPKPTFDRLGFESAIAILHEADEPTAISLFATSHSKLEPVCDIPLPSGLPTELVTFLRNDEWKYYTISKTPRLISAIGNFGTYEHHVTIRKLRDGIERYIFGPAGLCVHTVCHVRDQGMKYFDVVPQETLYFEERIDVICPKTLKWWYESQVLKGVVEVHENMRRRWDSKFRAQLKDLGLMERVDLLA